MILLSIVRKIRHLINGINYGWLLNLNLIYKNTADTASKWFVDFDAEKIQLVSFDLSNNSGAIDVTMYGYTLEEKSSIKMLKLPFSSELDWGSYTVSIT